MVHGNAQIYISCSLLIRRELSMFEQVMTLDSRRMRYSILNFMSICNTSWYSVTCEVSIAHRGTLSREGIIAQRTQRTHRPHVLNDRKQKCLARNVFLNFLQTVSNHIDIQSIENEKRMQQFRSAFFSCHRTEESPG